MKKKKKEMREHNIASRRQSKRVHRRGKVSQSCERNHRSRIGRRSRQPTHTKAKSKRESNKGCAGPQVISQSCAQGLTHLRGPADGPVRTFSPRHTHAIESPSMARRRRRPQIRAANFGRLILFPILQTWWCPRSLNRYTLLNRLGGRSSEAATPTEDGSSPLQFIRGLF